MSSFCKSCCKNVCKISNFEFYDKYIMIITNSHTFPYISTPPTPHPQSPGCLAERKNHICVSIQLHQHRKSDNMKSQTSKNKRKKKCRGSVELPSVTIFFEGGGGRGEKSHPCSQALYPAPQKSLGKRISLYMKFQYAINESTLFQYHALSHFKNLHLCSSETGFWLLLLCRSFLTRVPMFEQREKFGGTGKAPGSLTLLFKALVQPAFFWDWSNVFRSKSAIFLNIIT